MRTKLPGQLLILALSVILVSIMMFTGCTSPAASEKPTIRLAGMDWTSYIVETEILKQIIEKQLDYPTETIAISASAAWVALDRGDIDLAAEIWLPGRKAEIQPFLDKGTVIIGSEIFPALLGWGMPRYVIEGNSSSGTKPLAPDFKSILDLQTVEKGGKDYWKLFVDSGNPGLGELVGGAPGWTDNTYDRARIKGFDLPLWRSNQTEAVMIARVIAADKKKIPILFSFSSPHWIYNAIDIVTLEEPVPWYEGAFADETKGYACASPPSSVCTVASSRLKNKAPLVHQLVTKLVIGTDDINNMMYKIDIENQPLSDIAADWISRNQGSIDQWLGKN